MRLPYHKTIIVVSLLGFLICVALILSGCAMKQPGNLVMTGAASFDYASTRVAMAHGAREANVVLGQNPYRQAAVKIGGLGLAMAAAEMAESKDRQTLARVVRTVYVVINVSAGMWNLSQVRR